jgi:hypothetical protein
MARREVIGGAGKGLLLTLLSAAVACLAAEVDDEAAMARAQRVADRVRAVILRDADTLRAAKSPAPAPAPSPKPAPAAVPNPKPAPRPAAVPPADPKPVKTVAAATAASAPSAAASAAPRAAALAPAPALPPPAPAEADAVVLADFETSIEGARLRDVADNAPVRDGEVEAVADAFHGKRALRVLSPRDAWLALDFPDPQDWHSFRTLLFAARTSSEDDLRIGFKTGSDWNWCQQQARPIETVRGYTLYRANLGGRSCPDYDATDVRSLQISVKGGATLHIDYLRLQP